MRKPMKVIATLAILSFLAVSCASKPSTAFSGSEPKERNRCTIALDSLSSPTGGSFKITGIFPDKIWIEGSWQPDGKGSYALEASSLHWFSNWNDGWTEASFEYSCQLTLAQVAADWTLAIVESPLPGEPMSASIRYRDAVLDQQSAIKHFCNRWDRIRATASFLKGREPVAVAGQNAVYPAFRLKKDKSGISFYARNSKLLFPEIYGYTTVEEKERYRNSKKAVAEDIKWNLAYTEDTFPENLREIRDTGTMFRDWEESAELFYLATWHDEMLESAVRNSIITVTEETKKKEK